MNAAARHGIHVRRLGKHMPHETHRIVAMIVRKNEDDVAGLGTGVTAASAGTDMARQAARPITEAVLIRMVSLCSLRSLWLIKNYWFCVRFQKFDQMAHCSSVKISLSLFFRSE